MIRSQKLFVGGLVALAVSVVIELALAGAARLLTGNDPLTPDQPNFDLISGLGWLAMAFFVISYFVACITFIIGWRHRAELMESATIGRVWSVYRILFIVSFILTVVGFGIIYLVVSFLGPVR